LNAINSVCEKRKNHRMLLTNPPMGFAVRLRYKSGFRSLDLLQEADPYGSPHP